MGQEVLTIQQLTHGYQDRTLFKHCDFEMEKGERVVLIGATQIAHAMHVNMVVLIKRKVHL